ncbi:Chromosome transmission fidelity protein 8 [Sesamum angolense]|uniref:Chromosome transmission fidelity protein 8 n=1 Tax=Sesamum angolense TaxID=2727404 RepID=A0AAE2BGR0_9LAMI|nr:Chromosome transmission fidelity protein 8 [Sesamum angolense]
MQIKVKCSCGEGNCPEWAIVELQGVVEAQPTFENRLQNLQIGVLCRPSSQENYTFTVGYHELTGTKVSLKKPILVLKKIKLRKEEEEEEDEDDVNSAGVELDVIGVIRHKILFKTRPKALISSKDTSDVCKKLINQDTIYFIFGSIISHVMPLVSHINENQQQTWDFQSADFLENSMMLEPQPAVKEKASAPMVLH